MDLFGGLTLGLHVFTSGISVRTLSNEALLFLLMPLSYKMSDIGSFVTGKLRICPMRCSTTANSSPISTKSSWLVKKNMCVVSDGNAGVGLVGNEPNSSNTTWELRGGCFQ